MSIQTQLDELAAKVQQLGATIKTLIKAKVQSAFQADNALALNGKTAQNLTDAAAAKVDSHANRRDNPHNLTAAQIGAYTTEQTDALIDQLLPAGIIPISRYGTLDAAVIPVAVVSGWTFQFTAQVPAIIAGSFYQLPAMSIDLSTVTPAPASKTFNVYARLVGGQPTYTVSEGALAESTTTMFIGKITTNASTIATIALEKVTRIDTYRISNTAKGSAIAVSNGLPSNTATLAWK